MMETDLPERVADTFPELYRSGALDEYFSGTTGFKAALLATFHAIVLTVVPVVLFNGAGAISADGATAGLWASSVASFFYIVPIAHFQIYFDTWNWTRVVSTTYAASLVFFIASVAVYDNVVSSVEGVWGTIVFTPLFWLGFCLATIACLLPYLAYRWYVRCQEHLRVLAMGLTTVLTCDCSYEENFVTSNPVHILRRVRCFNKILDASQVGSKVNETSQAVGPRSSESIK